MNNIIKLRYLEQYDLDDLLQIENDQRYWHLSDTTAPYTEEDLRNYISNAKAAITAFNQLRFVIDIQGQFAGLIDLYAYDSLKRKAGVGIIVKDQFRQKKVGQKSLKLLIEYCRQKQIVSSLFATIEKDNLASIKLFQKCNFYPQASLQNDQQKAVCETYNLKL